MMRRFISRQRRIKSSPSSRQKARLLISDRRDMMILRSIRTSNAERITSTVRRKSKATGGAISIRRTTLRLMFFGNNIKTNPVIIKMPRPLPPIIKVAVGIAKVLCPSPSVIIHPLDKSGRLSFSCR